MQHADNGHPFGAFLSIGHEVWCFNGNPDSGGEFFAGSPSREIREPLEFREEFPDKRPAADGLSIAIVNQISSALSRRACASSHSRHASHDFAVRGIVARGAAVSIRSA